MVYLIVSIILYISSLIHKMNLNPQDLNAILRQLNKQPEYTSYADKAISDQFDKLKTEF